MGTDDLIRGLGPREVADLAAGINVLDQGARSGVPEFDGAVRSTTAGGKQVVLMRRPSNGLHRSAVIGEAEKWSLIQFVPNHQLVVVAAGRQLAVIGVPLQATDFLLVSRQAAEPLVGGTDITVVDKAVSGSRSKNMVVPRKSANTVRMTDHGPEPPTVLSIPDLDESLTCAD